MKIFGFVLIIFVLGMSIMQLYEFYELSKSSEETGKKAADVEKDDQRRVLMQASRRGRDTNDIGQPEPEQGEVKGAEDQMVLMHFKELEEALEKAVHA